MRLPRAGRAGGAPAGPLGRAAGRAGLRRAHAGGAGLPHRASGQAEGLDPFFYLSVNIIYFFGFCLLFVCVGNS